MIRNIFLAAGALLLSACADDHPSGAEDGESSQRPEGQAAPIAGRVMGQVRWDDQERQISQVSCALDHGAWTVRGRGDDFRLIVELHGQEERNKSTLDPSQPLMVNLRLDQHEGPNLSFTMNSNHRLMGQVQGGSGGYSGQTLLVAANAAAGRLYTYPEGIEVDFEMNCPDQS